jgi:hypothetical protein
MLLPERAAVLGVPIALVANWQRSLIITQPATVLRWHRRGSWTIWASGSCARWRGGRPRISGEVHALIVRMSQENFLWGAPRSHGELLKLGFDVSRATVSRYMPRRAIRPPSRGAPSCGTRIWDRYDRSWRSKSAIRRASCSGPRLWSEALVRGWIARVMRCLCGMASLAGFIEPSSTLHRLRPYRFPIVLIGVSFIIHLGPPP